MVNEHLLRALQESRYQMLLDEAHRERLVKEVKPKRKPEPRFGQWPLLHGPGSKKYYRMTR